MNVCSAYRDSTPVDQMTFSQYITHRLSQANWMGEHALTQKCLHEKKNYYLAVIYLWEPEKVKGSEIVGWLKDAGASWVSISHEIHEEDFKNGFVQTADGYCLPDGKTSDGTQCWHVSFGTDENCSRQPF